MVLAFYGKHVPLETTRRAVGVLRGSNAISIIDAAVEFGLRGRGIRVDLDGLRYLPRGAVLHWGFRHFVVFERTRRTCVDIVDPACGRRSVPLERFSREFTGIAIVFEPLDTFTRTPRQRKGFWRPLARMLGYPGLITRVLISSVILRIASLSLPLITGLVVDRIVPLGQRDLMLWTGVAVALTIVFYFIGVMIRSHFLIELRARMDTQMTTSFVTHLMSLPLSYFLRVSSGDLMMRVNSNVQIRELLTSSFLSALFDVCVALSYLVILIIVSPWFALASFLIAGTQATIVVISRDKYRSLVALDMESQATVQSWLLQMFSGVTTLKASGAEERAVGHWANLYIDEMNIAVQRSRLSALLDGCAGAFGIGAPLALLWIGTSLVLDGSITLGAMMSSSAIALGFLSPVGTLVQNILQLQLLGSFVERIDDVMAVPSEQCAGAFPTAPNLSGEIELSHVSFRYDDKSPLILNDICLKIEAGSTVAIVGRSGSGKSTLASLLIALHAPTEGKIYYDGCDVSQMEHRSLRRQMGMVPQNSYLFSGTMRSNISLANPAMPLEMVEQAAKIACIHDDIVAMAMGYETNVSEGGISLSGGQCQRIAIARAVANRPAILLLDEATSSLDTTTERIVTENIRALGVTKIVIAHRLSTVVGATKVVVLENGAIAEIGSHETLMRSGGVYSRLVAEQAFSAGRREGGHVVGAALDPREELSTVEAAG